MCSILNNVLLPTLLTVVNNIGPFIQAKISRPAQIGRGKIGREIGHRLKLAAANFRRENVVKRLLHDPEQTQNGVGYTVTAWYTVVETHTQSVTGI